MESNTSEIYRVMASRECKSLDEANAFLKAAMTYKNAFLLPERPDEPASGFDVRKASEEMRVKWEKEFAHVYPDMQQLWP
jgi:hypothetical protein